MFQPRAASLEGLRRRQECNLRESPERLAGSARARKFTEGRHLSLHYLATPLGATLWNHVIKFAVCEYHKTSVYQELSQKQTERGSISGPFPIQN